MATHWWFNPFFDEYKVIRSKRLKCKFHVNEYIFYMYKKVSKNKKASYNLCGVDFLRFEIQD